MNMWAGTPSSLSPQNTATGTGSNQHPRASILIQERTNWCVAAHAFACISGDTFTIVDGTLRQSVVPALTSVGVALVDNTGGAAAVALPLNTRISTARQWAVAGVELRSGSAVASAYKSYTGRLPVTGSPLTKETRYFGKMPVPFVNPGAGGPTGYGWST
jgi:hypothetical protein